jgi:L-seryl-tRNA(Ser) seleniumtransferase
MTLAALDATLASYVYGKLTDIPLFAMLSVPAAELRDRAERVCAAVKTRAPAARISTVNSVATTGGGTLPDVEIPSAGIAVRSGDGPDAYAARLRAARPPVIGRVEDDRLIVDLRTVRESDLESLAAALAAALSP